MPSKHKEGASSRWHCPRHQEAKPGGRAGPGAPIPPLPRPPLVLSESSPIKAHSREDLVLDARTAGQERLGLPLRPTGRPSAALPRKKLDGQLGEDGTGGSLGLGFKEEEL